MRNLGLADWARMTGGVAAVVLVAVQPAVWDVEFHVISKGPVMHRTLESFQVIDRPFGFPERFRFWRKRRHEGHRGRHITSKFLVKFLDRAACWTAGRTDRARFLTASNKLPTVQRSRKVLQNQAKFVFQPDRCPNQGFLQELLCFIVVLVRENVRFPRFVINAAYLHAIPTVGVVLPPFFQHRIRIVENLKVFLLKIFLIRVVINRCNTTL